MDTCAYPKTGPFVPKSVAMPLSEFGRMAQIRTALGEGWRRLPTVDGITLRRYYRYLSQNLSLPFAAWHRQPSLLGGDEEDRCTVVELIDPATGLGDESDGIFCKVRIGQQERTVPLTELVLSLDEPNGPLVEHYGDWFWHWR